MGMLLQFTYKMLGVIKTSLSVGFHFLPNIYPVKDAPGNPLEILSFWQIETLVLLLSKKKKKKRNSCFVGYL